jgi:ketosteroid isomerase-like protein
VVTIEEIQAAEKSVMRVITDITDALRRQDLEAYMNGFHKDVIVARQRIKLLEGLDQWRKSMENDIRTSIIVTYDRIHLKVSDSCDWAYCVADFKYIQGNVEGYEKMHTTLRRFGNGWKIVAFSLIH